jgi:hypothetical protein
VNKRITAAWLDKHHACSEGRAWWTQQGTTDAVTLIERLRDSKHEDWAIWTLVRILPRKDVLRLAVYSARLVQHLNTDPRVEAAIAAAEKVIERDSHQNRAAAGAAYAAAYAAAGAAYATYAADAAYAAAYAAYAAAYAAAGASIIDEGLRLIGGRQ